MLQVTESAAFAFRSILQREDVPGNAIRLAPTMENDGQVGITLQAVDQPGPDDAATSAERVEVVVAPELAQALDESVLDAKQSEDGSSQFVLRSQGETPA
jgi:Fe-S cluster assembly iron-binding protein IscA